MNYGSNIKFDEATTGRIPGKKYRWIASASSLHPDTIFINKHEFWTRQPIRTVINKITDLIPHETIHNILWCEGLDDNRKYDIVRNRIIHKRNMSKRIKDIYYRCC